MKPDAILNPPVALRSIQDEANTLEQCGVAISGLQERNVLDKLTIGLWLIRARSLARHGQWGPFLKKHHVADQTARDLMAKAEKHLSRDGQIHGSVDLIKDEFGGGDDATDESQTPSAEKPPSQKKLPFDAPTEKPLTGASASGVENLASKPTPPKRAPCQPGVVYCRDCRYYGVKADCKDCKQSRAERNASAPWEAGTQASVATGAASTRVDTPCPEGTPAEGVRPRDSSGNVIPDDLHGMFSQAGELTEVADGIQSIIDRLPEFTDEPGWVWVDLGAVGHHLKEAEKEVRSKRVTHLCPICGGKPDGCPLCQERRGVFHALWKE